MKNNTDGGSNPPGKNNKGSTRRARNKNRAPPRRSRSLSEDSSQDSLSSTATASTVSTTSSSSYQEQSSPVQARPPQGRRRPKQSNKSKNRRKNRYNNKKAVAALGPYQNHMGAHSMIPPDHMTLVEKARCIALDCEMVGVGPGGLESALARISMVNWYGEVLLDTYVQVHEDVTDYRTFVSGIRPQHLESGAALEPDVCRHLVATILRGKILIGHGLQNDLTALRIDHPWYDTRDTVKYAPYMKPDARGGGLLAPRKLRDLAAERLGGRNIQPAGYAHSSVIDAMAALDLYKLARRDWEKVMQWNVSRSMEIEGLRWQQQQQQQAALRMKARPVLATSR